MLIIHTKPIPLQTEETCYQDVIQAVYNWHRLGPRSVIPGYWITQQQLFHMPPQEYLRRRLYYDEKAFHWAIAMAGVDSDKNMKAIESYYEKNPNSEKYWALVKKAFKEGKKRIEALSNEDHLRLIRHFNPDFLPCEFDVKTSPAALELALRKYGPLFAAGDLSQRNQSHVVMIVGLDYDAVQHKYNIVYQDGLQNGLQQQEFDNFIVRLSKDPSAILRFTHEELGFVARGNPQAGTLFRFKLHATPQITSFNDRYYFKPTHIQLSEMVELPAQQLKINQEVDLSFLAEEKGYVYVAIPDPYHFNDLNNLSLVFCCDPHEALSFLELRCEEKRINKTASEENLRTTRGGCKRTLEEDHLVADESLNESWDELDSENSGDDSVTCPSPKRVRR